MITFALTFVCGAWVLQQMASLPQLSWALLLVPLAWLAWHSRGGRRHLSIVLVGFVAGLLWATLMAQLRLSYALPAEWQGQDIRIQGVVASLPQRLEHGQRMLFDVEQRLTPASQLPATLLPLSPFPRHLSLSAYNERYPSRRAAITHQANPQFHAGQRWELVVRLKQPQGTANPHGLDFEAWALQQDIRAVGTVRSARLIQPVVWRPGYLVEMMRERIALRLERVLADKDNVGVLKALAIGDESAIRQTQWQVFILTGTNHLMSISGLHITMLAGLCYAGSYAIWRRSQRLTLWQPARKAGLTAGAVAALAYALVAGFSIPTQRTLYMLLVVAWALWSGRQLALSRVLAYALLLVTLLDPWAVLAPGFWLSFSAIAVIALVGCGRLRPYHWLRGAVLTQWAVTIGLLPLLVCMFQQVSLVAPLANAVAIPLVSLVVVPLTLLGCVPYMDWVLLLAHAVMTICMQVLDGLLWLPWIRWQQAAPPLWTLPLAILGALCVLLPRGFPLRWMGLVALLPMLCFRPVPPLPGTMRVSVLDVGQGLAVVVQTAGHTLLYDTGPRYSANSDSGIRVIVPFLRGEGVSRLQGMVVSHDDDDHSGGMASVVTQIPTDWLLSSISADQLQRHLDSHAGAASANNQPAWKAHGYCLAGQAWEWDQVRFEMLSPPRSSYGQHALKDNDRSCVLRISSRYGSLLLPGDIERWGEATLLAADLQHSDVVVVPHHGSRTSSSPAFVRTLQPGIAIFTVGYRNRFGHPKAQVVQRYSREGSQLYRSDRDGAILLDFTAQGISVNRWRQQQRRYWQPPWHD